MSRLYLAHELTSVSDVTLEGVSVMANVPREAFVSTDPGRPSYVLLEKRLEADALTQFNRIVDGEPMIDGQILNITYYGNVEVIA